MAEQEGGNVILSAVCITELSILDNACPCSVISFKLYFSAIGQERTLTATCLCGDRGESHLEGNQSKAGSSGIFQMQGGGQG